MKYLHIYSWSTITPAFKHKNYLDMPFSVLVQFLRGNRSSDIYHTTKHMIVNTIIYSRLHLDK